MGGHKGCLQPYGFYPNGLLPNEVASVTRVLEQERWSQAEERTAELIAYIQPNQPSVERRNAIASYVKCLIMKCFPCQVFTFGSVPLKTYLPDGDIDLTAFSNNQNFKDNWANYVREILESEERNDNAEFRVKEVQYINAEVKIIKCLVENIVVDISINQLGGLCALCFLEEVDNFINHSHLFKRSIILIKAWCYYESRILGAHHGLISTYALETLVLYIFHVFNNSFAGPLEVLYRFLEFFSKFDWDNFCLSLWGPVPISSVPNMAADPPRNDGVELSLSKLVYACMSAYTVFPHCQDYQDQPFVSKYFNIVDPLRINNNLGRSVSKGNFFRIRSALAFGAQRLARLLDCPKENLIDELNQFFMNTWKRHGNRHCLDALSPELYDKQSGDLNKFDISESFRDFLSSARNVVTEKSTNYESETAQNPASNAPHGVSSKYGKHSLKQMCRTGNVSAVSHNETQKAYANTTDFVMFNKKYGDLQNISSKDNKQADKGQNSRPVSLNNEAYIRSQFARTYSSPELTCTSSELPFGANSCCVSNSRSDLTAPTKSDNGIRRNLCPEVLDNHSANFQTDKKQVLSRSLSQQSKDAVVDSNSDSNNHHGVSSLDSKENDGHSDADTMQLKQEEQDFMNLMASRWYSISGQVPKLVNLTSASPPLPIIPPVLTSHGHAQKNLTGITPTSIPAFDSPWVSNMHYSQGLFPLPVTHYYPGKELATNQEEMTKPVDSNLTSRELNQEDGNFGYGLKQNEHFLEGYCHSHRSSQAGQLQDEQKSPSDSKSSGVNCSDSYALKDQRLITDNKGLIGEGYADNSPGERIRESDVNSAASSRFLSSQATATRMKLSSEIHWDGFLFRPSKSTQDKHERESVCSVDLYTTEGLAENRSQYEGESVDPVSSLASKHRREWIPLSTVSNDEPERLVSGSAAASDFQTHSTDGFELAPVSGLTSILPVASVLVGSESQQMTSKSQGLLPFTFYPCSAAPFMNMLPVYNAPTGTGTSSISTNHYDGDKFDNCQSGKSDRSLDSMESLDRSEAVITHNSKKDVASGKPQEQHETDILNGDFVSHLQNLQYGRFCQSAGVHGSLLCPSSVFVPPIYLQGHILGDSPGRPPAANIGLFRPLMGCSPHLTPVSQLLPGSSQPARVYERWGNETPQYHSGRGTFLSNPNNSSHSRQSSSTSNHKGSYGYNRKNHVGKREGSWNANSKPRFAGCRQGHNQAEKPKRRMDKSTATNSRSHKHDYPPSYNSHTYSVDISNSINHGSANVAPLAHPLPVINHSTVSHSRTAIPSLVMLYPYDQNVGYWSAKQPECGSLGAVRFSGMDEVLGVDEQHDFQDDPELPPVQPSSPQL